MPDNCLEPTRKTLFGHWNTTSQAAARTPVPTKDEASIHLEKIASKPQVPPSPRIKARIFSLSRDSPWREVLRHCLGSQSWPPEFWEELFESRPGESHETGNNRTATRLEGPAIGLGQLRAWGMALSSLALGFLLQGASYKHADASHPAAEHRTRGALTTL